MSVEFGIRDELLLKYLNFVVRDYSAITRNTKDLIL